MRYLYTADGDNTLFAYAPGRHDFFRAGDDSLWAHESHGWLIAAKSGESLAHRTGDVFYGAVDGKRLYRLSAEPAPGTESDVSDAEEAPATRRSPTRVASQRATRPRR
jgi:hypothetical protein